MSFPSGTICTDSKVVGAVKEKSARSDSEKDYLSGDHQVDRQRDERSKSNWEDEVQTDAYIKAGETKCLQNI